MAVILMGAMGCRSDQVQETSANKTTAVSDADEANNRSYGQQPELLEKGRVDMADLSPIGCEGNDVYPMFFEEKSIWARGTDNKVFQYQLKDGTKQGKGSYMFAVTLDQFSRTTDGMVWSGCLGEDGNAYLMKFDEHQSACTKEYSWENTAGFIKVIGCGDDILYIHRIELGKNGEVNTYYIEKYNTKKKELHVLHQTTYEKSTRMGSVIHSLALTDDKLYAMLYDATHTSSPYFLEEYSLDGERLRTYDLPEYDDAFIEAHSLVIDINAFDEYIAIKSLQNVVTIFRLQGQEARRIYFGEKKEESEKHITELMEIKQLDNVGNTDVQYVFFRLEDMLIVYDKSSENFDAISFDRDQIYPVAVNSEGIMLFATELADMPHLYTINIGHILASKP